MSGDITAKILVVLAGLIACGACVGALFEPAVEEADEEGMFAEVGDGRPAAPLARDRDVVVDGGVVAADGAVVTTGVGGVRVVDEPERVIVPALVVWAGILVGIVLTAWAVMTPAASLGRPALIAGLCVLVGVGLAWALSAADLSDYHLNSTALLAWLSVAFSLLAAWLIISVLSTPGEDEIVPG